MGELPILIAIVIGIATAFINIVFAFCVFVDALELRRYARRKTILVLLGIWAFATLIGGVFVAAIYWALHHSTMNPSVGIRTIVPADE